MSDLAHGILVSWFRLTYHVHFQKIIWYILYNKNVKRSYNQTVSYPVFEWIYITSPHPYISLKKRDRLRRWVSGSYTPNYSLGTASNTLHTLCKLFKPLEFMSYMFMLTPKLFLCPHFSPFHCCVGLVWLHAAAVTVGSDQK